MMEIFFVSSILVVIFFSFTTHLVFRNFFIIKFKSCSIFSSFSKLTFLHTLTDKPNYENEISENEWLDFQNEITNEQMLSLKT